jgi:hypothetical protein
VLLLFLKLHDSTLQSMFSAISDLLERPRGFAARGQSIELKCSDIVRSGCTRCTIIQGLHEEIELI